MIKVFIIENQQLMREGLQALVKNERDMIVTGIAQDTEEAFKKIEEKEPDVVLIDVDKEGFFAIDAGLKMKEQFNDVKVILLSSDLENETLAFKALSFGF